MKPAEEEPIFINVASFSMSSAVLSMKFSYDEKMRKSTLKLSKVEYMQFSINGNIVICDGH